MKKLLKYTLLVSVMMLCVAEYAHACVGPYYLPSAYYMFRAYDYDNATEQISDRRLNCLEWQQLTSVSVSLDEIEKIVYRMPYEEFEELCKMQHYDGYYRFMRYLQQFDHEALEFLRLAKENEFIRLRRNSRWYYPTMKIPTRRTLEEIADEALAAESKRFRDRYLLQAVRALFTLGRFKDCVAVWESEASKLPKDNLMRRMIQPYIAGAEFRLNHNDKAIQYFAELGDVSSMRYCARSRGETINVFELLYKYNPDGDALPELVQHVVHKAEPTGAHYCDDRIDDKPQFEPDIDNLYNLALRIAKNNKEKNPAFWYYTAAFIDDLRGNINRASELLALAEKTNSSDYIKESIKVLRIYLDAKRLPYNKAYEERLFEQLKWLDKKICDNITSIVREKTANWEFKSNVSYYYWNDMLRRILLSVVCPRMEECGKHIRAAQLANMADNRLAGLTNMVVIYGDKLEKNEFQFKTSRGYTNRAMPLEKYRLSNTQQNIHDYNNKFFRLIDSFSADMALAYLENTKHPKSDFDRFLNARGYTNEEYLREIVGTLYLREMRYAEAEEQYSHIKFSFYGHLNVCQRYDPFSIEQQWSYDEKGFRYKFAKRMNELQREIDAAEDVNKKALLTLRYAIGMINSVGLCWSLTYYEKSMHYECCKFPASQRVRAKAKKLIAEAEVMAADPEIKAAIEYELCNFKIVGTQYPDTKLGKMVRGQCDKLIDYHADEWKTWYY